MRLFINCTDEEDSEERKNSIKTSRSQQEKVKSFSPALNANGQKSIR